jgi:hypothetical protein
VSDKIKKVSENIVKEFLIYSIELKNYIPDYFKNHGVSHPQIVENIVNILKKDEYLFRLYNGDENNELTLEADAFLTTLSFIYNKSDEDVLSEANKFLDTLVKEKEFKIIMCITVFSKLEVGLKIGDLEIIENAYSNPVYKKNFEALQNVLRNSTIQMFDLDWYPYGMITFKSYYYRYVTEIIYKKLELPFAVLSFITKSDMDVKYTAGLIYCDNVFSGYLYPLSYSDKRRLVWFKSSESDLIEIDKEEIDKNAILLNITRKSELTSLEKRILGAIRLFGISRLSYKPEIRFIMITSALERLLVTGKDNIAFNLSEMCSFLLKNDGNERYLMFKHMKELYTKRSNLVHEGKGDITNEDVRKLETIFYMLIYRLLPLSLKYAKIEKKSSSMNKEGIEDYVNNLKYHINC